MTPTRLRPVHPRRAPLRRAGAAVAFAGALAAGLTACGSPQEAPTVTSGLPTPPADRSVPVVAGPNPARSSTTSPSASTPVADEHCGAAKGPDGALEVHLIAGDVTCDTAMAIAKEYSPLIATGKAQSVSGWDCGPSQTTGELARCTRDGQVFAFLP